MALLAEKFYSITVNRQSSVIVNAQQRAKSLMNLSVKANMLKEMSQLLKSCVYFG